MLRGKPGAEAEGEWEAEAEVEAEGKAEGKVGGVPLIVIYYNTLAIDVL